MEIFNNNVYKQTILINKICQKKGEFYFSTNRTVENHISIKNRETIVWWKTTSVFFRNLTRIPSKFSNNLRVRINFFLVTIFLLFLVPASLTLAGNKVKRLLLVGQGPDGHPVGTHEFMPGVNIIADLLQNIQGLELKITKADEPWQEGPELLDAADGLLLFVSQGARWMNQKPDRLDALKRFGRRGGACVALHWGMGTVEAQYIAEFVKLFGGCHGGPDRKHQTLKTRIQFPNIDHPVSRGLNDLNVYDEFYYQLKFVTPLNTIIPLAQANIDGKIETISWAWERSDGGRSFGFSGLHFHKNWNLTAYRRLMIQAILWTLKLSIPVNGVNVDISEENLKLN